MIAVGKKYTYKNEKVTVIKIDKTYEATYIHFNRNDKNVVYGKKAFEEKYKEIE